MLLALSIIFTTVGIISLAKTGNTLATFAFGIIMGGVVSSILERGI